MNEGIIHSHILDIDRMIKDGVNDENEYLRKLSSDVTSLKAEEIDAMMSYRYCTYDNAFSPLYLAISKKLPYPVIKFLITLYPQCIFQLNHERSYPIHIAISSMVDADIVELLLDAGPSVVFEVDASNRLPLHLSVRYYIFINITKKLIQMHPEGLKMKDVYGKLPLHLAVGYPCPYTIMALLEAYPEACFITDNSKQLPLHGLIGTYLQTTFDSISSFSCLRFMLNINPVAVLTKDCFEDTPLDLCPFYEREPLVSRLLLNAAAASLGQSKAEKLDAKYELEDDSRDMLATMSSSQIRDYRNINWNCMRKHIIIICLRLKSRQDSTQYPRNSLSSPFHQFVDIIIRFINSSSGSLSINHEILRAIILNL